MELVVRKCGMFSDMNAYLIYPLIFWTYKLLIVLKLGFIVG